MGSSQSSELDLAIASDSLDDLLNPVREILSCGLCHRVLSDATQCPNEHLFCRTCITKFLLTNNNNQRCPFDCELNGEQLRPAIRINELMSKMVLNCKYSNYGCTFQESFIDLMNHEVNCEFKDIDERNQQFRSNLIEFANEFLGDRMIKNGSFEVVSNLIIDEAKRNLNRIKELEEILESKFEDIDVIRTDLAIKDDEIEQLRSTLDDCRTNLVLQTELTNGLKSITKEQMSKISALISKCDHQEQIVIMLEAQLMENNQEIERLIKERRVLIKKFDEFRITERNRILTEVSNCSQSSSENEEIFVKTIRELNSIINKMDNQIKSSNEENFVLKEEIERRDREIDKFLDKTASDDAINYDSLINRRQLTFYRERGYSSY